MNFCKISGFKNLCLQGKDKVCDTASSSVGKFQAFGSRVASTAGAIRQIGTDLKDSCLELTGNGKHPFITKPLDFQCEAIALHQANKQYLQQNEQLEENLSRHTAMLIEADEYIIAIGNSLIQHKEDRANIEDSFAALLQQAAEMEKNLKIKIEEDRKTIEKLQNLNTVNSADIVAKQKEHKALTNKLNEATNKLAALQNLLGRVRSDIETHI